MASEPFSVLYDAMIAVLKADHRIHVVDWNSTRDPLNEVVAESDLPEIQIRPSGLNAQLGSKSCGSEVQRRFEILVNTGDKRLGALLFPTEWVLLGALHRMKYGALDDLKFNNRRFVEDVMVNSSTSGIALPESNRGIDGWASLWDVVVYMSFSGEDLS